jgi:hypothetical protein
MVNCNQEATMKTVAISGACQPRCNHSTANHGPLFAIDGQFFRADPKRGVTAGLRLYCGSCAVKIWTVVLAFFSHESSHHGDIWIRYG